MVRIYLNMENLELDVHGHANTAEAGKDLVCCAASMLIESLSRYAAVRESEGDMKSLINEIRGGRAIIASRPCEWSEREVTGAYEVIREGLRALARDYPEYITLEEV